MAGKAPCQVRSTSTPPTASPHGLQALDHLDPHRPDLLAHAVVGEGARGAQRGEPSVPTGGDVAVDDPHMGVHAEAGGQLVRTVRRQRVHDAAVVDVAVARDEVLHRLWTLMDRVFVERYRHVCSP
jgi:hypothetical protein